jgi:uncharacterized membrane protein
LLYILDGVRRILGSNWGRGVFRFCDFRAMAAGLWLCLAVLAGVTALPGHALAALSACNKTSYVLETAVGFQTRGHLASRGWFQIEPGQCRTLIDGTLDAKTYYTFAYSSPVHIGEMKYFSGAEPFCTEAGPQDFNIAGQRDCDKRGFVQRGFARIETGGNGDWTTSFTEAKEYSLEEARIAGVQRLLLDIGASDAAIDGFRGGKTTRAVMAFKRKNGLGEDASMPSALYAALIKEAEASPRAAGFRFCNETDQLAWGAIGYDGMGDPISTGWFKIPPHGCTDAIKERLRARVYYSYAEADRKSGGLLVWGGQEKFCTSEDRFVIRGREACERRGYTSTGFMRVNAKGTSELVQTLTSEGASTRRDSAK